MSEPIQAIATNNYLLATQQEVSHDNTLSGNGTSASPLGVVNGYNETVLWSGYTKMEDNATVVASEPLTNFETVQFFMEGYGDGLRVPQVLTFSGADREFDLAPIGFMGTSIRLNHQRLNFNGGLTGTFTETIQILVGTNGSVTSSTDRPYINKIVGINRKSGV